MLIIALYATSCKTPRQTVEIRYRDISVPIAGDKAAMQALFECDSLNNVLLRSIDEQTTSGMQTAFTFDSGVFTYEAVRAPDTVYVPAKDSIIYRDRVVKEQISVPVNTLTLWQKFLISVGKIALILAAVCLLPKSIKLILKLIKPL